MHSLKSLRVSGEKKLSKLNLSMMRESFSRQTCSKHKNKPRARALRIIARCRPSATIRCNNNTCRGLGPIVLYIRTTYFFFVPGALYVVTVLLPSNCAETNNRMLIFFLFLSPKRKLSNSIIYSYFLDVYCSVCIFVTDFECILKSPGD